MNFIYWGVGSFTALNVLLVNVCIFVWYQYFSYICLLYRCSLIMYRLCYTALILQGTEAKNFQSSKLWELKMFRDCNLIIHFPILVAMRSQTRIPYLGLHNAHPLLALKISRKKLVRVYNVHGLLKKIVVGNVRIKYQSYIDSFNSSIIKT